MPLPPTAQPPDRTRTKDALASILAIAAVYVYFLIFAEFAFIENLRGVVQDAGLKPLMAALGVAGIAGSLAAAKWFSSARGQRQLTAGFAGCALAAGLSLAAQNQTTAIASAVAVGSSLAWTTVILVLCLRPTARIKHLGLCCGLGTGLAYAICNQPLVFNATPRAQTVIALIAAFVGLLISFRIRSAPIEKSTAREYQPRIAAVWVILFLTLVWIDSAAFFILQHSPQLKASTWSGLGTLQCNAFVHFFAAAIAGLALDRRQQPLTIGIALLALLGACVLLGSISSAFPTARILYTAAVSIYSTALVFHPARGGRPWLAGTLFAVSGWFGSAMGIGMVQSSHHIPALFVTMAAFVATSALLARYFLLKRGPVQNAALSFLVFLFLLTRPARSETTEIKLGHEVYISEGCIHCHSQYVRPATADVERWGPTIPLAKSLSQKPPLYGNRRQGPDLSQIASRRTPEWNHLHLIAPRSLTPGSRMPSYAHLFKENNPRGTALVAYLATLGAENVTARNQAAQAWHPSPTATILSEENQRTRFTELCSSCHGPDGHGDGPLSAELTLRPPDFTRDPWRHVSEADPTLELQLARLVKFGQPGAAMAGHEYLTDSEIVSLARFVLKLHK